MLLFAVMSKTDQLSQICFLSTKLSYFTYNFILVLEGVFVEF